MSTATTACAVICHQRRRSSCKHVGLRSNHATAATWRRAQPDGSSAAASPAPRHRGLADGGHQVLVVALVVILVVLVFAAAGHRSRLVVAILAGVLAVRRLE
jgi:hypothetical protein